MSGPTLELADIFRQHGLAYRQAHPLLLYQHRLLTMARDPQRLGVEIGFFAVLHSWGQNLHYHPHLHCVGSRWRPVG